MRFLIDFFPLVLFAATYFIDRHQHPDNPDLYLATAVLMVATVVQTAVIYVIDRRLQNMHKITLGAVLLFGGLTLVLRDDAFLKWKPTVLYVGMAVALGLAHVIWKKNLLRLLLSSHFELPDNVWAKWTALWIGFFLFLAAANAYVVMNYSTEFWVSFKLWGYAFWIPFMVIQGLLLAPHLRTDDDPKEDVPADRSKD